MTSREQVVLPPEGRAGGAANEVMAHAGKGNDGCSLVT